MILTEQDQERFWAKVALPNKRGCMLWRGGTSSGYGRLALGGRSAYAHRVSYALAHGSIPAGLVLDHLCRTPRCVRPDHLEAVTIKENLRRGEHKKKGTHCRNGHALAGENLYVKPDGEQRCRICSRAAERKRDRQGRRKAA